jgi:hypothetical protein
VVNHQDKNPGKIQELVVGVKEGRLVYVVLSIGGFLGMVNKAVCHALESLSIPCRSAICSGGEAKRFCYHATLFLFKSTTFDGSHHAISTHTY